MTRLLSGARPTGILHIGHYFGAFKQFVDFTDKKDSFFVISDIHMLTTKFSFEFTKTLPCMALDVLAQCISFGIDPNVTTFYIQSQVPEQAFIYSIIQSLASIEELINQNSFIEMSRHSGAKPTLGLLGYPVLESSDIIGIQASHVTVGEGNLSHIAICKSIISKLNLDWQMSLNIPEPIRGYNNLAGLDGNEKMSKSLKNGISLIDSTDTVNEKLKILNMSSKTKAGKSIILEYLEYLVPNSSETKELQCILKEKMEVNYLIEKKFKAYLLDVIEEFLNPIRYNFKEIRQNEDYLTRRLDEGRNRVRDIFHETCEAIKTAINLPKY